MLLRLALLFTLAFAPPGLLNAEARFESSSSVDDPHWPQTFDNHFKKYTKRYFGFDVDWRWFKAQAIVESNLDPKAKGASGAIGLMQLHPGVRESIKDMESSLGSIHEPRYNIAAGILYNRYFYNRWIEEGVPFPRERLFLTFASYNAGLARVQSAYNKHADPERPTDLWKKVKPKLPPVTRAYVDNIQLLMNNADY